MINVVNVHKVSDHIYCGRGSPLGNPFPIDDYNDRNAVCDMYFNYFHSHITVDRFIHLLTYGDTTDNPQFAMLADIYYKAAYGDVNLGCYCAPRRCHCVTIKEFIEAVIKTLT